MYVITLNYPIVEVKNIIFSFEPSTTMGNSMSSPRYSSGVYWMLLLCLMLPPDVNAWNVPFFGNNKRTTSQQHQATPNESITAATMGMAGAAADKLNNVDPTLSPITERMFGPMDAPHLRYIPSYFSNQIPDRLKQVLPLIASRFHKARTKMYHLLWYKPPVGIVSVWGFMRVMERVYGLYSPRHLPRVRRPC